MFGYSIFKKQRAVCGGRALNHTRRFSWSGCSCDYLPSNSAQHYTDSENKCKGSPVRFILLTICSRFLALYAPDKYASESSLTRTRYSVAGSDTAADAVAAIGASV